MHCMQASGDQTQKTSLQCLESSLLQLANSFKQHQRQRQQASAVMSSIPTELIGGDGAGALFGNQLNSESLGYLHCSGKHLLTCAVPVAGNEQLAGRISAETASSVVILYYIFVLCL